MQINLGAIYPSADFFIESSGCLVQEQNRPGEIPSIPRGREDIAEKLANAVASISKGESSMSGDLQLAELIANCRRERKPLPRLASNQIPEDLEAAYEVQREVRERLATSGWGTPGGYKIGCTTPVMQEVVGVSHPCSGTIFEHTILNSGSRVPRSHYAALGIECEIAVRMGADLPPRPQPYTRAEVAERVAAYLPAIELVDNRYPELGRPDARIFIADDFYGAGSVLGEAAAVLTAADLNGVHARLVVDGQIMGEGDGSMVMGHPLEALVWLANRLAHSGEGLKRGSLVSLGSLVATFWVPDSARHIEVIHDPLGRVELDVV
jgi:2-keto-4-pentenoate hydratase